MCAQKSDESKFYSWVICEFKSKLRITCKTFTLKTEVTQQTEQYDATLCNLTFFFHLCEFIRSPKSGWLFWQEYPFKEVSLYKGTVHFSLEKRGTPHFFCRFTEKNKAKNTLLKQQSLTFIFIKNKFYVISLSKPTWNSSLSKQKRYSPLRGSSIFSISCCNTKIS